MSNPEKEKPVEYVLLDRDEEPTYAFNEHLQHLKKVSRVPWGIHLFSLVLSFFLFLWFIIVLCLWLLFGGLHFVTFFQSSQLKRSEAKLRKRLNWASVMTLGLFVAAFSLPLGLGFILLYFSLQGQKEEGLFFKVFKSYI